MIAPAAIHFTTLIAEVSDKIALPPHMLVWGSMVAVLLLATSLFASWRVWLIAGIFAVVALLFAFLGLIDLLASMDRTLEAAIRNEQGEWYHARMRAAFIIPIMAGVAGSLQLFRWQRATDRRRQGLCTACSYDLSGLRHGVCPECGGVFGK